MGKIDLKALKGKLKEVKERSETGPFWIPDVGDNSIRILPPHKDMDTFFREGGVHFNVSEDEKPIICPRLTLGDDNDCPICELVKELIGTGEASQIKLAKKIKGKPRFYMNVIDMNDKGRGVQVYAAGIMVFKDLLSFFTDPDYGDMTDLEEGRNITVTKSGSGLSTKYEVRPRPKVTTIKKAAIKGMINLDDWEEIEPDDYDDIKEQIGNFNSEEDGNDGGKDNKEDGEDSKEDGEDNGNDGSASEDLDWSGLKEMDADEIAEMCAEDDLETDPDDFEDDIAGLRRAIAKERDIEVPAKKKTSKGKKGKKGRK